MTYNWAVVIHWKKIKSIVVTFDNIIFGSLTHDGQQPNTFRPSSTLLDIGGVRPIVQQSKHTTVNHDGGLSHIKLSIKRNPSPRGTLVNGCTPSTHGHVKN